MCNRNWVHSRQIYLETLDSLIAVFESKGDINGGVAHAMLALHNDSTRECTHRALMRLFYASGDRNSALRQYERCADALRTELGVEPDEETKALERRIRAGHDTAGTDAGANPLRPMTSFLRRVRRRP